MKLLIINPNSDEITDKRIEKKAKAFVQGAYEVDVTHVKSTPKLIATLEDVAAGLPEMMDIVRNGSQYDAFVVACHSDPNLDVLKEITNKPVVGIAEASMKIASMCCNGFAVISPSEKSIPKKWMLARKYYCDDLYKAAETCSDNEDESLYEAAKRAVEQSHVDGIVLGCANYTNADRYIEQRLGVKVFDGVACALILASGMVMYKNYKEKQEEKSVC